LDILCAEIELHFPDSGSLKEKRMVLKGTKDRLRERFGVSLAELDFQDLWQRTLLGIALVSSDANASKAVFQRIRDHLYADPRIVMLRFDEEWR
jgi:hypothetical protein